MRSSHILLSLVVAASVSANPRFWNFFNDRETCNHDNCYRAVAGFNDPEPSSVRSKDCSNAMSATNPAAAVPTYASACSGWERYSSVCSCMGITSSSATTTSTSTSSTVTSASRSATSGTTSSTTVGPTATSSSSSSSSSSAGSSPVGGTFTTNSSSSGASSSTSSNSSPVGGTFTSGSSSITSTGSGSTSRASSSSSESTTSSASSLSNSSTSTTITSTSTTTGNATSTSTTAACTTSCANPTCLSDAQANNIAATFAYLLASPNATNFMNTSDTLLSCNFTDTSDSINYIAGIQLGSVTFASKDAFIAGSGSQPPLYTDTYDVFHDCYKIAWRWVTTGGAGDEADAVKGMTNFYTDGCGHIYAVYTEFDNAAFLYNLGYTECSSTAAVTYASTLTSTLPATPAAATTAPALTTISDPTTTAAAATSA